MRTSLRAAAALLLTFASVVGPVSAATTPVVIEQSQQQGVLAGTVTDSRNSALAGATVTVEGPGGSHSTMTDGKGQFSISLTPAVYTLSISKGGYQVYRSDEFSVAAGVTTRATYPLIEATTSSLRVIGSTTSRGNRVQPINRDIIPNEVIGSDELQSNQTPNLNNTIEELPGVTLEQGNRSTLSYFEVRGADIETKTEIDGHPLSAGVSGLYYTGLLNGNVFQSIELQKGAGVSNADDGQSAFGTINLRTWDFSDNRDGFVRTGIDSYDGQFTSVLFRDSFLKDKRLSVVANYNVTGYNGPAFGYNGPLDIYGSGGSYSSSSFPSAQNPGTAVIDFLGPFNAAQRLTSETFKLRWRFNDTTALQVGYVGSQGDVNPEGSAYGYNLGVFKITPCVTAATFAACSTSATFGNPSTYGYIGQTIPLYSAYPGENQTENNPLFEAELRTAFKDNTILIRPFTQVINRINDGTNNPNILGSNGGFSLVTAPGGTCSAATPCYQYTGVGTGVNTYTSATNPCPAGGSATIYSCYVPAGGNAPAYLQYELDRLHGVTATLLHPIKNGTLRFSYEYTSDSTFDLSGNLPTSTPAVSIPGLTVPDGTPSISSVSNLSIPSALLRANQFSVGLNVNPTERILIGAALFYNEEQLNFQYLDPTVQSYSLTVPGGLANLPALFDNGTVQKEHLDPHVGISYAFGKKFSLRADYGSSVTLPYAKLVSGLPTLEPANASLPFGYIEEKNPNLAPETSTTYDVGFDWRVLPGGGVFRADVYSNTIFDKFLTQIQVFPDAPGIETTQNAANYRARGLELSAIKTTPGWGYNAQFTLQNSYYYNLGPAYFAGLQGAYTEIYNNRQLDGVPYSTGNLGITYLGGNGGPDTLRGEIGVRYVGPNNSYFEPAFKTFYGSLRVPTVVKGLNVIMSFRNIGGYQDDAGIAKASVFGTGMSTNACKFTPSASNPNQYVSAGCEYYTNGAQQIEPRSASLALQYRL